ncbi:MAG: hypothetical protein QOF53_3640 [Nocardioidaceae bacterium]|nr:hypothetical protein [Nocardioidaceae bacterium]
MSTSRLAPGSGFDEVEAWVLDLLRRTHRPGASGIVDVAEVAVHPQRELVVCTVQVRWAFEEEARRQVVLVALDSGEVRVLELPFPQTSGPAWSPDGRLVVVGATGDGGAVAAVLDVDVDGGVIATSDVPGLVESCAWSPDGSRLALQVAMPGAEISDVYGSGVVGGDGAEPWRPRVLPSPGGRRVAFVWDPARESAEAVTSLNVWEVVWSGPEALLALTSEAPDEGAWYAAVLSRLDLRTGSVEVLHRPAHQLAEPRSPDGGGSWSVLSGVQSDRGLPAGALLVSTGGSGPVEVDTEGVYVNDHRWLDETTVLYTGLRGLDTVVALVDVRSGETRPVWSGPQTSGEFQPEVSGIAGRPPVVVLEDHLTPPTLGVLEEGGFRALLAADGEGPRFQSAQAGRTSRLSWTSSDGLEIQGLLTVPAGEAPYPVVVHVHGGPTHAWRDTWSGRDPHTTALVARGYAVLRPNPRGSTGHGAAFAEAVYGDMGGLDVDDVVSGVEHLVGLGVADPSRVGITGNSYGGFMATWVPCRSELFAASVARSPATDWLTQHLTSNIAEFDRLFVQGDPFDPASHYASRSPLRAVDRIRTPVLLTAGLLDLATPASQAQVLYSALAERGVDAELAIYPEEGHGVRHPEAVADQVARMIRWFERFMPPDDGALPLNP